MVNIAKELNSKKLSKTETVIYDFSRTSISSTGGFNYRDVMVDGDIFNQIGNSIIRSGSPYQINPLIKTAAGEEYVVQCSRISFSKASSTSNTNTVFSVSATIHLISKKHNKTYKKVFSTSTSRNIGSNTPVVVSRDAYNAVLDGLGERMVIWTNNRLYKLNK